MCQPEIIFLEKKKGFEKQDEHTIWESKLAVVRRRLKVSSQIVSVNVDVHSLVLVPVDHLLGTLGATVRVSFAPDGRLRDADGGGAPGVRDLALESLVVHVGLSASVGYPAPLYEMKMSFKMR